MLEQILQWNLPPAGQKILNVVLLWIGFSLVIGFIARLIVPGRVTRGAMVTLLIGLSGSCVGPLLLSFYLPVENFNPIGFLGFLVSVATSVILILLFRFFLLFFPLSPLGEKNSVGEKQE